MRRDFLFSNAIVESSDSADVMIVASSESADSLNSEIRDDMELGRSVFCRRWLLSLGMWYFLLHFEDTSRQIPLLPFLESRMVFDAGRCFCPYNIALA